MIDFAAIAAHYAASWVPIFLALALAYIMPVSAAFDASEEVNLQSDVVWVVASIVGLGTVVYSICLLRVGLLEGLIFTISVFAMGYIVPRYLVLIVALLLPNFRFVDHPDPLIDLAKLPTALAQPIAGELDAFKKAPLFERRFRFSWIDFTIRFPRLRRISESELKAMYARATERAKASEQALHQQTAELEAQLARDLPRARVDYLASLSPEERGLLAARLAAQAEADRGLGRLLAEKEILARQLAAVIDERDALKRSFAHKPI